MKLVSSLVCFGLRQVLDVGADEVVAAVEQHFADHSLTLTRALATANKKAWRALGIALAGDGLLGKAKIWLTASGDDKAFREQLTQFLAGKGVSFDGSPAEFRQACLTELNRALKANLLSAEGLSPKEIAWGTADFRRYTDPQARVQAAEAAVARVAQALAPEYPNLAQLLGEPTPGGPPLLVSIFCYFFRREVETDDELAHGLFFDGLRQLTASQAKAFGEVNKALATLGVQFDALLEQVGRIEVVVVETHGAVLDLQVELQRLGGLHLAKADEVRSLLVQVQQHLSQLGMQRGEVRPQNSFSIRGEDERKAVKALLHRFRHLPPQEQQQVPALLNGLGKLQVGSGDFSGATETFAIVAAVVGDPAGKAEALFNQYRAALEERKWEQALRALQQAASLDHRFATFPLHRYEPKRILGAGGFGTAVLCLDRHFDEEVVVKTLHTADLERGLDDVFREARTLRRLSHPAIIGVRDCEYADAAGKARPYVVMDYFPGETMEEFVEQRGTLTPEQLVPVAVQIARAMQAAHGQGVLHRDLKPANVLVRQEAEEWQVKVIDFGLALRKQVVDTSSAGNTILSNSVAGTLMYAPPEQLGELRGGKAGPYSDVYAFGKTCCYALFKTTEPRSRQHNTLPGKLWELLEKCIEQEVEHRHPNFEAVLQMLEAIVPAKSHEVTEAERRQQERDLARLQEENFRAWLQTSEPRLWVEEHLGQWSEEVRVSLVEGLKRSTYWPMKLEDVWRLFEELKRQAAEELKAIAEAEQRQLEYDRVIADCDEAIRQNPKDASAFHKRGNAWHRKKEYEKAIGDYDKAIRLKPKYVAALVNRGNARKAKEEYDRAIADYDEAIRLNPNAVAVFVRRGNAWEAKEEYDRAIADYEEAIRLDPANVTALVNRANVLRLKREYDRAITDYDEAIRLDPRNDLAFYNRGDAWQLKKEYNRAIADYDEAIRLDPRNDLAFYHRGNVRQRRKEYERAIADYDEAIRLDPKNSSAFQMRGNTWRQKKEYGRAIADYDEAIRLDPANVTALVNRGSVLRLKKEYGRAIADCDEAIRLDPRNASAFNTRAWIWGTCEDVKYRDGKRAVTSAKQACQLTGWKIAIILDTLAAAYAEAGDFAEAIKWETTALDDLDYQKQYGDAALKRLKLFQEGQPYRAE